jgi:molecular chaperone DnaK
MEGSDAQAIKNALEELQQASHKLAEAMYQQASASAGAGAGQGDYAGQGADAGARHAGRPEDDVVDADFEEVKDKK